MICEWMYLVVLHPSRLLRHVGGKMKLMMTKSRAQCDDYALWEQIYDYCLVLWEK